MIDPKVLRETPDRVRDAIVKKRIECDLDAVLRVDAEWRTLLSEVETLRGERNAANTEMAALKKGSPEFLEKVAGLRKTSAALKEKESILREVEERWKALMLDIPNLPHETVPPGDDPSANVVHATWGDPDSASTWAVAHDEIPWFPNVVDFKRGVKVTGAGFPFFVGDGARLVRALVSFFLDEAAKRGYREIIPPLFVNQASATATGQLPDKEGQMYQTVEDSLFAIPTSEVPLTNFHRDEIFAETDLPVRCCAYSPCFRREAGSYGKDVRGLNRVHQFDKVELVKWVHPDTSYDELESLRADSEHLLQQLELPYRVLLMCTADLGFTQSKKYDLEVWAAGQGRWLEVSSCSNFEAFQARRAGIRFRSESGRIEPVHTLNGSALALPRVIAALLENNLQEDGRVLLPPVLRERMGQEFIGGGKGSISPV